MTPTDETPSGAPPPGDELRPGDEDRPGDGPYRADGAAEDGELEPTSDEDSGGPGVDDRPARGQARRAARRRRRRRLLGSAGAVLVLLVVGALLTLRWYRDAEHADGLRGAPVIVTVPAGASQSSVAPLLARAGVLDDQLAFTLYRTLHSGPQVQAGQYQFRRHESFLGIEDTLAAGPNVFTLTFVPGVTMAEIADKMGEMPGRSAEAFLRTATSGAVRSPYAPSGSHNLDGLVLAGNYQVTPDESDQQVLQHMVDAFDAAAAADHLRQYAAANGVTPYQAVIVASIVEKEGYYPKNFAQVARVIYNRLARGMPLQMDSTVLYSLGQDGGPVTQADRAIQSPYNTFLHTGLTPTPICVPSFTIPTSGGAAYPSAMQSALHPPAGSWLYFVVVSPDGTEAFASTYSEFLADLALAKRNGAPS